MSHIDKAVHRKRHCVSSDPDYHLPASRLDHWCRPNCCKPSFAGGRRHDHGWQYVYIGRSVFYDHAKYSASQSQCYSHVMQQSVNRTDYLGENNDIFNKSKIYNSINVALYLLSYKIQCLQLMIMCNDLMCAWQLTRSQLSLAHSCALKWLITQSIWATITLQNLGPIINNCALTLFKIRIEVYKLLRYNVVEYGIC